MSSIEESEVVLLGWWASMYTSRVRIALSEKRINYENVEQDIVNKGPLLLKHNPIYKKVPVLIHKGKSICDSKIIVQYIDETWKEGYPLLPSDPYLKSQAAFWADYIDKHKAVDEFLGYLKVLENELGEKPYFNGESFGFVDMALICYYNHLIVYGRTRLSPGW
ncbi:putative glutathione transferase [Helianthus annuus]|nr:putative glutathione transferase [Helianthus annuus]